MVTPSAKQSMASKGMKEARPGSKMPSGGMPGKKMQMTDKDMPAPAMEKVTSSGNGMPAPEMQGAVAAAGQMPSGSMGEGTPGARKASPKGMQTMDATRFRPANLPPGAVSPDGVEPGIIEVEFREGVRPRVTPAASRGAATIASAAGVKLSGLQQILRQHQLERAEPSFHTSEKEAMRAQAVAQQQDATVPNYANFVTLHFPPGANTQDIANELSRLPEVERAVPVPKAIPPRTPLDEPLLGDSDQVEIDPVSGMENQWYIFRCGINDAWTISSGDGVVIADIDFGYRTGHQDLAPHLDLSRAYNAVDGSTNVSVGEHIYHGTGVLGIAGSVDNNMGMAGIAFESTLWPVQANAGAGAPLGGSPWARAIDWVRTADSGGKRKVIILEVQTGTYGNYEMLPSVNVAIRTAIAHGVVVCVAAGNGDRDAGLDDAGNPIPETGSILVGATSYNTTDNHRAWFSNYGPRIVACAPGDSSHDLTCDSSSDSAYRNGFGGTSGATPKVAGTVALMLSVNPGLTHADIMSILKSTGTPVITEAEKPLGVFIDAEAAVREARDRAAVQGMEVFARGADKALWRKAQTDSSGGWSDWTSLGGWINLLKAGKNADGRSEVFVRGSDRALWHKWQLAPGGDWSNWLSQGGWIDRLALGQNADGRMEVFVRGSDKALWHKWQLVPNGDWSDWHSLGGWIDAPVVGRNADGRMEVFVIGADGALWHKWQLAPNGDWSDWLSQGGWIDRLTVGQNADGRLEVFGRGSDGALWHKWQLVPNGDWGDWHSLGGWIESPVVGSNADGRLEVFVIGADGALWHKWQLAPNGDWSDWLSQGGWIDRLDVGRSADGRLDVFGRGSDGALWHKSQLVPNGDWGGWESLGGWIDMLDVG